MKTFTACFYFTYFFNNVHTFSNFTEYSITITCHSWCFII